MIRDREIMLEQALIGVIAAAQELGVNLTALPMAASKVLQPPASPYRVTDHPHPANAISAISHAVQEVRDLGLNNQSS